LKTCTRTFTNSSSYSTSHNTHHIHNAASQPIPTRSRLPQERQTIFHQHRIITQIDNDVAAESKIHYHVVKHINIEVSGIDTAIEWDTFLVDVKAKRMNNFSFVVRCY
jgi:hypothetical protein